MDQPAVLLQAIQAVYPDLGVTTARLQTNAGQFNDILIVNEALVFRFPRYASGGASLQAEVSLLRLLKGQVAGQRRPLPLLVPDPIYTSQDIGAPGRIFMGYPLIPGQPLWQGTFDRITDDETLERLAQQLAGFLQALHSLPPSAEWAGLPVWDGLAEWQQLYAGIRAQLFEFMRPAARRQVSAHFEAFFANSGLHTYAPALRHGDFGAGNILYDPARRAACGVIDFDFAGIGDPAIDIAAVSCFGAPFFQRFSRYYPGIETLLERAQFYRGTYALQEALHGWKNDDREAFESGMEEYV